LVLSKLLVFKFDHLISDLINLAVCNSELLILECEKPAFVKIVFWKLQNLILFLEKILLIFILEKSASLKFPKDIFSLYCGFSFVI
jgi:hypothetical protein